MVQLRRYGNLLQIIPALPSELGDALTFTRRIQMGRRAADAEYVKTPLYRVERFAETGELYMCAPFGLYSRVVRELESRGVQCSFTDLTPLQLEEPDFSRIDTPREGQDIILAKLATAMHGQIEAPTGDGKTWIIVQVCKMYPHTRILIVEPGIGEARTIYDRLLSVLPSSEVGRLGAGEHERDRRITVCVKNSLLKIDPNKVELLMYDEVHTAGGEWTGKALAYFPHCKMFGFSATTNKRADKADLLVEALFGPVIHMTTYQESVDRGNIVPIHVRMRSVEHGPAIDTDDSTSLNRWGIWRNRTRNEQMAQDATAYSARGEQVLVAVATVEHGLELLRCLSGFSLVYSDMDPDLRRRYEKQQVIQPGQHPLPQEQRMRMQKDFERGELRRVIATCWNQGVDFRNLQVLVRGDGTASAVKNTQLPGRLSRTSDGKEYGQLVDYMDEFNDTLHQRALKRSRSYVKMHWLVIHDWDPGAD